MATYQPPAAAPAAPTYSAAPSASGQPAPVYQMAAAQYAPAPAVAAPVAYQPYPQPYAQQPAYAPAPQFMPQPAYTPAPVYVPAPALGPDGHELRTVYITGFPQDVKERELNNLLRFLHGYEVQITCCGLHPRGYSTKAGSQTPAHVHRRHRCTGRTTRRKALRYFRAGGRRQQP